MELHPNEVELIKKIREDYRFGVIEIQTRNGLPVKILKTTKYEALDLNNKA
jgi:hypothetical protein